jgi:hypothetical protein
MIRMMALSICGIMLGFVIGFSIGFRLAKRALYKLLESGKLVLNMKDE